MNLLKRIFTDRRTTRHSRHLAAFAAALTLGSSLSHATTNIDVLVVYTDAAATWAASQNISCDNLSAKAVAANSRIESLIGYQDPCLTHSHLARDGSAIKNLVDMAMQETNDVYTNSGITDLQFNLAAAVKLVSKDGYVYSEAFDDRNMAHAEPLAENLAKNNGIPYQLYQLRNRLDSAPAGDPAPNNVTVLNSVHDLRAQYHADLVVMLVNGDDAEPTNSPLDGDSSLLGVNLADAIDIIGLSMGIGVQDPRNGFAVLRVQHAITPGFVFAHEVSHLFGANHAEFNSIDIVGPLDAITATPHLANGKIDNWAFNNAVDPDGSFRTSMYSTLMGGIVNTGGGRVIPDQITLDGETTPRDVLSALAWDGDTSSGKCVAVAKTSATDIQTLTTTHLPILSNLATNVDSAGNPTPVGTDGSGTENSACITVEYSLDGGVTKTVAMTVHDNDTKPRNNARIIPFYAPGIAAFSDELNYVDPGPDMVGIDFGASSYQGWDITPDKVITTYYDFETHAAGWNNVTDTAADTSLALTDASGNSGGQLTIDKKFYGSGKLAPSLESLYAYGRDEGEAMALSDYFTAIRLYTPPQVTISGLDDNKLYTFRVFGANSASQSFRVANMNLGFDHGDGTLTYESKALGTQGNIARFVEFQHVKPVNGEVKLRVVPALSVEFFTSVGLSAITYFSE